MNIYAALAEVCIEIWRAGKKEDIPQDAITVMADMKAHGVNVTHIIAAWPKSSS